MFFDEPTQKLLDINRGLLEEISRLKEENEALRQGLEVITDKCEALRRDAERYRWLRDAGGDFQICLWQEETFDWTNYFGESVVTDAAIDAAMKEST